MPGMLWEADYPTILESVDMALALTDSTGRALRFVELGVHEQGTSEDLYTYIKSKTSNFLYYCVDLREDLRDLGENCRNISGNSWAPETLLQIQKPIHWVFIDACHCCACVHRDTLAYSSIMQPGGILVYHDASPRMQGRDPQLYSIDHDSNLAISGIKVREALDTPGFCEAYGIELVKRAPDQAYGGTEVYRKKHVQRVI